VETIGISVWPTGSVDDVGALTTISRTGAAVVVVVVVVVTVDEFVTDTLENDTTSFPAVS
jgi:hypothetical protein